MINTFTIYDHSAFPYALFTVRAYGTRLRMSQQSVPLIRGRLSKTYPTRHPKLTAHFDVRRDPPRGHGWLPGPGYIHHSPRRDPRQKMSCEDRPHGHFKGGTRRANVDEQIFTKAKLEGERMGTSKKTYQASRCLEFRAKNNGMPRDRTSAYKRGVTRFRAIISF